MTGAPISDVEFLVTDSDGSVIGTANGRYVTDSAGTIRIDGLTPGMTVIAWEVRAKRRLHSGRYPAEHQNQTQCRDDAGVPQSAQGRRAREKGGRCDERSHL